MDFTQYLPVREEFKFFDRPLFGVDVEFIGLENLLVSSIMFLDLHKAKEPTGGLRGCGMGY